MPISYRQYKIVHGPAACEARKKPVPDPPQALCILRRWCGSGKASAARVFYHAARGQVNELNGLSLNTTQP